MHIHTFIHKFGYILDIKGIKERKEQKTKKIIIVKKFVQDFKIKISKMIRGVVIDLMHKVVLDKQ